PSAQPLAGGERSAHARSSAVARKRSAKTMSTPAIITELADASERQCAIATFDHNLVVTAGAGTGKTTLLVDRLVQLLLRNPEPLKITEIVALTFTNKAADEMKLRLRQRLQAFLDVQLDREAAND